MPARPSTAAAVEPDNRPLMMEISVYRLAQISPEDGRLPHQQEEKPEHGT
ncbi:hypothetical protein [Bradyrhizobium sp. USDA 4486]